MPLITLTSDIGQQDYLAGAIKARLLILNPDFNLVDISHNIPPFNYPQASYVCKNAIKNFPDFTYHIILVNLFEKRSEHLLLAFHNNQYIFCDDNGLLTMLLDERPEMVIGIPWEKGRNKNTLHCIDVFGKAINQLINGESIKSIGDPDVSFIEKTPLKPAIGDDWIDAQIIFIDNFENVIVNLTHDQFEEHRKGRSFKITFKRDETIEHISETYADVTEGQKLALFNSASYLEIAINKGNAAGLLGLKGFSEKTGQSRQILQSQLYYQTVRISFE
jgi:S-adenosylmethionine hydrolase